MTRHVAVHFGKVAGTQAGLGRAGTRSLIADRPEGVAGGQGLGFSGAEFLAAALGGCFWNDLHVVAQAGQVAITVEAVEATVELAWNPPRVVRAQIAARLSGAAQDTLHKIFTAATEASTIANSLHAAFPIHFEQLAEVQR